MFVAVDCHVTNDYRGFYLKLLKRGHRIVVRAREGEPDEQWVHRAMSRGAEIFVSQDWDIERILRAELDEGKVHWISIPQNLRRQKQARYILDAISRIIQHG